MERRGYFERFEDLSQDSLRYTSIEEAGNEKLIITIDIGDGRKDELIVCEDDDPLTLAREFCSKHHLGQAACKALAEQIEQNLDLQPEDELSTLISVNKSYDVRSRRTANDSSPSQIFPDQAPSSKQAFGKTDEKAFKSPETKSSSIEKSAVQSHSPIDNYGQKLYVKGLRFIENVEKKKHQISQDKAKEEMKEVTFRPRINSSKNVSRNLVEDFLLRKGKEKQEHIERKRGEKLAQELSDCTFSPNICKKSEKINRSQEKSSPNRFMHLYNNAKVTRSKVAQNNEKILRQDCPFIPDTNKTKNSVKKSENREKISQSRKMIEEYLSAKTSTKDPKTGQEFFRPVTGRPPASRRTNSQPIGDYLYSQRSKSSEPNRPAVAKKKLSSQQSEKILKRIKELRYRQIFDDLRPDEHERITPEGIKRSTLSPRTYRILTPLLKEMESLYEKLNFYEFCESMEILMKVLRPDERSIVLKICKTKNFEEKVQEKSLIKLKSNESLYERNVKKLKISNEKTEMRKKVLENIEVEGCTFKPKILKYPSPPSRSDDMIAFEPFKPLSESYFY